MKIRMGSKLTASLGLTVQHAWRGKTQGQIIGVRHWAIAKSLLARQTSASYTGNHARPSAAGLGRLAKPSQFPNKTEPKLFLQFLSTAKVTQFATDLAQDLARRYPPAMANNPVQMVSEKRLATLLASSFEQAQKFALENQLGFIRKAILSNSFKWTLKDLGYKDLFIQIATEGLVVHITRKPTASKP